ncbi:MAG TPA: low temperature requirement protein A [Acidimicrobiia bacterium]|nr:low temperature requirement protein A [Acidimicrobiia bacterium]
MGVWLELFYDLVFVAAILVFSSAVSHLHDGARIGWVVIVFAAVWWIWLSTTIFTNRFRMTDLGHRLLLLLQMFLVVLIAIEARAGVVEDETYLALTYGALVGTVAAMYWRAWRQNGSDSAFAAHLAALNTVAAALFLVAGPLPEVLRIAVAALGIAVVVLPAIARSSRLSEFPALDEAHLVERLGAFTIIVCGESFVKVAIAVSNSTVDGIDVVALAFQFVLTFALWASYFEDIPHAGLNQRRAGPWLACHLATQLGIAGTAIGVSKLVALGFFEQLPAEDILEIMATLALVYLGLAGIGVCTRRRPIRPLLLLRLATALVVVIAGVAAWQLPWFDLLEGVAVLTVVAVGHAFLVVRLRARTEVVALD